MIFIAQSFLFMEAVTIAAVTATFVEAEEKIMRSFVISGSCRFLYLIGTTKLSNGEEYNIYAHFNRYHYMDDSSKKYDDVHIVVAKGNEAKCTYSEKYLAEYYHNHLANSNWRPGSNPNIITYDFIFFTFVAWLCDVKFKDLTDAKLRPRVEEIIKKQSEIKERYNEIRELHWQYLYKNVIIEYDGNKYDLHERFYELDKIMETKLTYDDLRKDCKKLNEEFIKQNYD